MYRLIPFFFLFFEFSHHCVKSHCRSLPETCYYKCITGWFSCCRLESLFFIIDSPTNQTLLITDDFLILWSRCSHYFEITFLNPKKKAKILNGWDTNILSIISKDVNILSIDIKDLAISKCFGVFLNYISSQKFSLNHQLAVSSNIIILFQRHCEVSANWCAANNLITSVRRVT